jgi:hypothetical protein
VEHEFDEILLVVVFIKNSQLMIRGPRIPSV